MANLVNKVWDNINKKKAAGGDGIGDIIERKIAGAQNIDSYATPRYKTNFETWKQLKDDHEALVNEWVIFQKTFQENLESSRRLHALMVHFAKMSSGVSNEDDLKAFQKIWADIFQYRQHFVDVALPPFINYLNGQDVQNMFATLQIASDKYTYDMVEKQRYVSRAQNLQTKQKKDQKAIEDATTKLQEIENNYRLSELSFEDGIEDFQTEKGCRLLANMSNFLNALQDEYRSGSSLLEPTMGYSKTLQDIVQRKMQSHIETKQQRTQERIKLHQLRKQKTGMDDKAFEDHMRTLTRSPDPTLLPGEKLLLKVERVVRIVSDKKNVTGILYITNFRFTFQPYIHKKDDHKLLGGLKAFFSKWSVARGIGGGGGGMHGNANTNTANTAAANTVQQTSKEPEATDFLQAIRDTFTCPLLSIGRIEITEEEDIPEQSDSAENSTNSNSKPQPEKTEVERGGIMAGWLKDLRAFIISFRHSSFYVSKVFTVLNEIIWSHDSLFAFSYKLPPISAGDGGWYLADDRAELGRFGLPNPYWKISDINAKYEVCGSYPRYVGLPAGYTDAEFRDAAKFRTKNRFPALVWKREDDPVCILRSSQPKVGLTKNRNGVDERMLYTFGGASVKRVTYSTSIGDFPELEGKTLVVLDCRPKVNAVGNLPKQGGWELLENYPNIALTFLGIENIHDVRNAFNQLQVLFENLGDSDASMSRYDGIVKELRTKKAKCSWFKILSAILKGAVYASRAVSDLGVSVLVHCSDGWDRTPQVSSLAQILLDPYYRTIRGFCLLIEKEWLSFGHRFAQRRGHELDRRNYKDPQRSPIFTQFCDCVFQILAQYPTEFEFDSIFLVDLLDHVDSGRFGTFLYNSQRERNEADLTKKTPSLWSFLFLKGTKASYLNPFYKSDKSKDRQVLALMAEPFHMQLFLSYYIRWDANSPVATSAAVPQLAQEINCVPVAVGSNCMRDISDTETSLGRHVSVFEPTADILTRKGVEKSRLKTLQKAEKKKNDIASPPAKKLPPPRPPKTVTQPAKDDISIPAPTAVSGSSSLNSYVRPDPLGSRVGLSPRTVRPPGAPSHAHLGRIHSLQLNLPAPILPSTPSSTASMASQASIASQRSNNSTPPKNVLPIRPASGPRQRGISKDDEDITDTRKMSRLHFS